MELGQVREGLEPVELETRELNGNPNIEAARRTEATGRNLGLKFVEKLSRRGAYRLSCLFHRIIATLRAAA